MLKKLLPHVCIILSLAMLTFLIIDQINIAMGFVNNQGTKIIMMVLCALTIAVCCLFIRDMRK